MTHEQGLELYSQNGVIMKNQSLRHHDDNCPGTLRIVRYGSDKFFEWHPAVSESSCPESDWTVVSKVNADSNGDDIISIEIKKIKEYRVHPRNKRKISFTLHGGEAYGAVFQTESIDSLVAFLRHYYRTKRSSRDHYTYKIIEERTNQRSFCDLEFDFNHKAANPTDYVRQLVRNFQERPVETALQTFAKLNDFYKPTEIRPVTEDVAEILNQSVESVSIGDEYHIVGDTQTNLPNREVKARGNPLTSTQWIQFSDAQGRVTDPEKIRTIIYEGGIDNSIRAEVWKFLLGYLPWDATTAEQISIRTLKEKEYLRMKAQWQSFTPDQEAKFADFRDRKSLIEKDVNRCDRNLDFYAGDENPNIISLYNILMTHVMHNFDLGYVQGMSDLLAPIFYIMNNENDAFWCFAAFMEKVAANFDVDQESTKRQLLQVHELLTVIDAKFAEHLKNLEPGYLFCFRWLLVIFKREFSYDDIMTVWEAFWTGLPGPNFHLFIAVAILENEKAAIMGNHSNFADTLKHINDLSSRIDVKATLSRADGIYHQLLSAEASLPDKVRKTLGLAVLEESPNSLSDSDSEGDVIESPGFKPEGSWNGQPHSPHNDEAELINVESAIMLNYL